MILWCGWGGTWGPCGGRTRTTLRSADFKGEGSKAVTKFRSVSHGETRDGQRPSTASPQDVPADDLGAALARALDLATSTGRLDLVERLLTALEARQREADGANVAPAKKTRLRGA